MRKARRLLCALLAAFSAAAPAYAGKSWKVTFDGPERDVSAQFVSSPSRWRVLSLSAPELLKRRNKVYGPVELGGTEGGQSVAIFSEGGDLGDLFLQAMVRIDKNGGSRQAGLLLKYRDDRDFLAAVVCMRDKAVRLIKSDRGNLSVLAASGIPEESEQWQKLAVSVKGETIECFLNGQRLFEARDGRSGRVGLVAIGGTAAMFDDFRLEDRSR